MTRGWVLASTLMIRIQRSMGQPRWQFWFTYPLVGAGLHGFTLLVQRNPLLLNLLLGPCSVMYMETDAWNMRQIQCSMGLSMFSEPIWCIKDVDIGRMAWKMYHVRSSYQTASLSLTILAIILSTQLRGNVLFVSPHCLKVCFNSFHN
jgi:hypothetical protein